MTANHHACHVTYIQNIWCRSKSEADIWCSPRRSCQMLLPTSEINVRVYCCCCYIHLTAFFPAQPS